MGAVAAGSGLLERVGRLLGDRRNDEYRVTVPRLRGAKDMLDIACGTGTFLEHFRDRAIGIDINPDNVE